MDGQKWRRLLSACVAVVALAAGCGSDEEPDVAFAYGPDYVPVAESGLGADLGLAYYSHEFDSGQLAYRFSVEAGPGEHNPCEPSQGTSVPIRVLISNEGGSPYSGSLNIDVEPAAEGATLYFAVSGECTTEVRFDEWPSGELLGTMVLPDDTWLSDQSDRVLDWDLHPVDISVNFEGGSFSVGAADEADATVPDSPAVGDHWHAAYGVWICDRFIDPIPSFIAPQNGGTHTHGDGLVHIHPFSPARSGANATLGNWFVDAGEALGTNAMLSDTSLGIPLEEPYQEGSDSCDGEDARVSVSYWADAAAADQSEPPTTVHSEDLAAIQFTHDGAVYSIAFSSEPGDVPPPPSVSKLASVSSDLGLPDE